MRRLRRDLPLLLLATGTALLVATVVAGLALRRRPAPATSTAAAPSRATATVPTTTAPTTTAPTTTAPPAPAPVPMSWRSAGGLVALADEVDPTLLGRQLRADGFGWIAVRIADGTTVTAPSPAWISLFRAASGLPVGGWSILRDRPAREARLAAALVGRDGLSFFVADAEQEYEYTVESWPSPVRFARSRAFVAAFRADEPGLPAALSSYCRPDEHDLDWASWAHGGFAFLPQAYVSVLGPDGDPAVCVRAAARWFPAADVHPTLGIFGGPYAAPSPEQYGRLLAAAGTTGFSLFPAETAGPEWETYGAEIRSLRIASEPG